MTRSRETGDVGYRAYKKNLLRNGNFSVNQRNWSGPIPASGTRTLDGVIGYENTAAGDDISFNQRTSTAGDAAITNQPYDMQIDFVSSDAATSTVLFGQLIEDGVQITAGLDVSMSCKMFSAVVREISIEFIQNFGAGGSPQVRGITKKISLIAGWQDVAVTLAIPAITGKTLGNTSSLSALIWLSSGSNESANNDSLGLQPDGVVVMTSWQVEIASSATPFEYVSPQENLATCQRYYQEVLMLTSIDISTYLPTCNLPVAMRVTPSIDSSVNAGSGAAYANTLASVSTIHQSVANDAIATATIKLDAEL